MDWRSTTGSIDKDLAGPQKRGFMKDRVLLSLVMFAVLVGSSMMVQAAEIQVGAAVERQEVYEGEAFTFQVIINGSRQVTQPDVSAITDFVVKGGTPSDHSQVSVNIVNGQMTRTEVQKVAFNYQLTAKRTGDLVIPPVVVKVEGKTYQTQSIRMNVQKAGETGEFKLRLKLPKEEAYVGEMMEMKLVWYIGQSVDNRFAFTVPIADDPRFDVLPMPLDGFNQGDLIRAAVNGVEAIMVKGQGDLDGASFTTLTWHAYLIPRADGQLDLPTSTVSFSAIVGYRDRQRSDPFGGFFGGRREAVTRNLTIGTLDQSLQVKSLPDEGRPDDFGGLVGQFRLSATANPLEVNVGDPITLTLALSGLPVMDHVDLPSLKGQKELVGSFKIPDEREAGKVKGQHKFFTQTIRALSESVKEIPAIRMPFFNPDSGEYQVATTAPIRLEVKETRIVTANDAEGVSGGQVEKGSDVEASGRGIAHNYEGMDVLEDQGNGLQVLNQSPVWAVMIGGSPIAYMVMAAVVLTLRRRNSNPALMKSRRALAELKASLVAEGSLKADEVLQILRQYLGARLFLVPGALTYADVEPDLQKRKLSDEDLKELKSLFDACEASRYAGDSATDVKSLVDKAGALAEKIEGVTR